MKGRETGKAYEESIESKKEPTEVKLKHRDELRVTQVRRAPSERIGMAVKLRDNSGTPESKVKRRMVSSDCSPSESQSARLQQEPIAWLSGVKSKDTGSKTFLDAKTKTEDVQVRRAPSDIKAQDVKLQDKSGVAEETTKKRSSSEGASGEEILVLSTPKDDAANDDTATADDTEFSQMFNKLRHKTYKKVKAPGDEKENAVLKTTAKDARVVTSSQKPPLADADSNAGVTADDPGKADVATATKTVLVIEKTVPKTSSKLESPSEGSLPKRSSPLLKDRTRRQTLPVSPSQSRALSPEKEEDSKVKRSVSQRKPTEPSPLASSPPSSTTSIIRASTAAQIEPKKLFSNDDDTSGSAPPWAAMARKKTSKFEQNKKLNKGVDVKSENVSAGADSKPEPVTTTPAVVDMSSSKTGYSNTEPTSSAATKPVVLIIAAKPATTNVASTAVSSTTVVSSVSSKTTVSSTTTKPSDSAVTSKSATTTTPAVSVPKTTGSSTVFASSVKSNAPAVSKPATNVVITRKKSDEKKAGEVR